MSKMGEVHFLAATASKVTTAAGPVHKIKKASVRLEYVLMHQVRRQCLRGTDVGYPVLKPCRKVLLHEYDAANRQPEGDQGHCCRGRKGSENAGAVV